MRYPSAEMICPADGALNRRGSALLVRTQRACTVAAALAVLSCGGRAALDPAAIADAGASAEAADGEGGASVPLCEPFEPCGGDLAGRWTIVSNCYESAVEQFGCDSLYHDRADSVAGTYEFFDTGTATFDVSSTVSYISVVTDSCASAPCDLMQASIERGLANVGSGTANCSAIVAGCSCDVVAIRSKVVSYPYSLDGSRVTIYFEPGTGATTTMDFCVTGNTLTLHQSSGSMILSRD
jgi:hypothetical protein